MDFIDSLFSYVDKGVGIYTQFEDSKVAREQAVNNSTVENTIGDAKDNWNQPLYSSPVNPNLADSPDDPTFLGYMQSFTPLQIGLAAATLLGGIILLKKV